MQSPNAQLYYLTFVWLCALTFDLIFVFADLLLDSSPELIVFLFIWIDSRLESIVVYIEKIQLAILNWQESINQITIMCWRTAVKFRLKRHSDERRNGKEIVNKTKKRMNALHRTYPYLAKFVNNFVKFSIVRKLILDSSLSCVLRTST